MNLDLSPNVVTVGLLYRTVRLQQSTVLVYSIPAWKIAVRDRERVNREVNSPYCTSHLSHYVVWQMMERIRWVWIACLSMQQVT